MSTEMMARYKLAKKGQLVFLPQIAATAAVEVADSTSASATTTTTPTPQIAGPQASPSILTAAAASLTTTS